MANSFYHLLGHLLVASHACAESAELAGALQKGGLAKSRIADAADLVHEGEAAIEEKLEVVGEDRIREHAVHASAREVEMWLQATTFRVKKAVDSEPALESFVAKSLHAEEHALTVVAKALRAMSMLRCDGRIHEPLGGAEPVRRLLNRGHALTKKLYKATEIRLAPEGEEGRLPIFGELGELRGRMEDLLVELDEGARAAAEKDERLVGLLGYVPVGVGIPAGGTSYAVVLHERGQADAPDPAGGKDCPGWSVGRQGRNRENLGKGWVTPEA